MNMKDELIKHAKKHVVWAIAWDDAHGDLEQHRADDISHTPWQFITVGIIVHEDDKGVTLMQEVDENGDYRGKSYIPTSLIVGRWRLRSLRPPKDRV